MANDYQGSIAQENVSYNTLAVFSTSPGDNYQKLMLFVGLSQVDEFLVTAPSVKTLLTFTKASYASETKGRLKDWLAAFYEKAGNVQVLVQVFVDKVADAWDPAGLAVAFAESKHLAYFKSMLYLEEDGSGDPDPDILDYTATLALAVLQKADEELSGPILVNEHSASVLTGAGTSVSEKLKAAGETAWSIYHPEAMLRAPTLAQLGFSLSVLNESGTPVGNSLDFVAVDHISASGVNGANLTSAQKTVLKGLNIGFFNTIGNGTGAVALIGGVTLKGRIVAADWVTQFCDYVNEVKTAELITVLNTFKNRKAYNQILAQLSSQLERFGDIVGSGRLRDIQITAPIFSKLPATGGDTITIPNAWTATYVDSVREVQVQGTLVIQL